MSTIQPHVPCLPLIAMALPSEQITWNGLYAAKPRERHLAEERIRSHFIRKCLACRGVEKADVRYKAYNLHAAPSMPTGSCRPTGWHGESGAARTGGHIVVDFYRSNNLNDHEHITTHHVYRTDDAYSRRRMSTYMGFYICSLYADAKPINL
jgi:hypothetical protein